MDSALQNKTSTRSQFNNSLFGVKDRQLYIILNFGKQLLELHIKFADTG